MSNDGTLLHHQRLHFASFYYSLQRQRQRTTFHFTKEKGSSSPPISLCIDMNHWYFLMTMAIASSESGRALAAEHSAFRFTITSKRILQAFSLLGFAFSFLPSLFASHILFTSQPNATCPSVRPSCLSVAPSGKGNRRCPLTLSYFVLGTRIPSSLLCSSLQSPLL